MARAEPGAGVAVEVLVEPQLGTPARILLEQHGTADDRAAPTGLQEDRHEPGRQVVSYNNDIHADERYGRRTTISTRDARPPGYALEPPARRDGLFCPDVTASPHRDRRPVAPGP
jgi:hypothetical protein